MSEKFHGTPCWYELTTSKGKLSEVEDFYSTIFKWQVADAAMPGVTYHLAKSDGDMVAGLMEMPDDTGHIPPNWMVYFSVADADQFVADAKAAGASVHREPADIPKTGRFAILSDPQGAAFGILQPDLSNMSKEDIAKAEAGNAAFNQRKSGHGNWHELMSTDPDAGFAFYSECLGWTKGDAMDMGDMGTYQLFRHNGVDIGGMMGLGEAPVPNWLPYFGVDGRITAKIDEIKNAGGSIHHGPIEVPGPAWIAVAQDPDGAWFAVVAPEK